MKAIKYLIVGLIIGAALGTLAGMNIGRGQPVLSNPFAEQTVTKQVKDTGSDLLRKSGEAMEDAGKALKNQFK